MDYAQLHRDLVRAVDRVCPRWMADRADDLVQVALMRVMEIQRKKEGTAEFSAFYLKKAAYSAMIDEIRRLRRRQEVSLEGGSDEEEAVSYDPGRRRSGPRARLGRPPGRPRHPRLPGPPGAPPPSRRHPEPPGAQRPRGRQAHGVERQEGGEPGLPRDVRPPRLPGREGNPELGIRHQEKGRRERPGRPMTAERQEIEPRGSRCRRYRLLAPASRNEGRRAIPSLLQNFIRWGPW